MVGNYWLPFCLTVASRLPLKRQESIFRAPRPEDDVKCSNDPRLKGGSLELIKIFLKIFFIGSWSGSKPEIHQFVLSIKVILIGQHPHVLSNRNLLVVHTWQGCLLKYKKGRNY